MNNIITNYENFDSLPDDSYEDDVEMDFGGMRKIPEGIYIAECISHEGVKVRLQAQCFSLFVEPIYFWHFTTIHRRFTLR